MAQCVQTPTLTTTQVSTSESFFPTSSLVTSTLPGSVSTSIFRTCTQTNSSVPCEPTLTSSLVTLPGNTTVVTVPATGTSEIPITNVVTLFGSSCSSSPSSSPSSTPSSTPSITPSSTPSDIVSTPPPSLIPTSSTVTSDGSTFVDFSTITSSSSPTTIASPDNTGTSLFSSPSPSIPTPTANTSTSTPSPTLTTSSQTTGTSTSSISPPTTDTSFSSSSLPPSSFPITTSTTTFSSTSAVVQFTGSSNNLNGNHSTKKSSNAGPIAGGVIGGIAALALLGFLTWRLIKRQPRFDDIFNKDTGPHYKKRTNGESEPKPYTYGLIGGQNTTSNPIGVTPPSSPPPTQQNIGHDITNGQDNQGMAPQGQQPSTSNNIGPYQNGSGGNEIGHAPQSTGNDIGRVPNQPPLQHLRNPSLTPLLAGLGVAAAAGGANAAVASGSRPNSSRPSSSASSQPSGLGPLVLPAQTPGFASASSYPPALQNWTNAQGYTPPNSSPAVSNTQGYAPGPSMGASQGMGPSPGGSSNSMGPGPSNQGGSSWQPGPSAGGSSSGGSGTVYNPVPPGVMPILAAAGLLRNSNSQETSQRRQSEETYGRSGSPVSFQEQRVLQVTNAEPSSPSSRNSREIYDPNFYYSGQYEAASSSSLTAGPSGSSTSGVDGKGRPLNLRGEKAPLVHLDGSLYQEPDPAARRSVASPAPPEYRE
ncbi:hypothetical protein CVT26_004888 [Gymnopilus dilepis]|uniref:Uncharacterized protein n=1 Tax=Gymnopilus dilepis TaxID=231916 RepID=A0A409W8B6_9AGAR|nr:hypothetical protein CVT26_004888 [Gymnopilus dilepis]